MPKFYEYLCTKCKVTITHDKLEYIECPKCKSGRDIQDLGDWDAPDFKGKDFSWNKP